MNSLAPLIARLREPAPPLLAHAPRTETRMRKEEGGRNSREQPCAFAENSGEQRLAPAAILPRPTADAAEALAAPDPDLAHERAEIAATLAAEARGDLGRPKREAEHRRHVAALLDVAHQRPPAWADQSSRPTPGCWCSCCKGRRWWAPESFVLDGTGPAPGWRCRTCRPAPPGAGSLLEVATGPHI